MANDRFDVLWDDNPVDVIAEANFIWSTANKLEQSTKSRQSIKSLNTHVGPVLTWGFVSQAAHGPFVVVVIDVGLYQ